MGTRQTPLNALILIVGVLGLLLAVAPIAYLASSGASALAELPETQELRFTETTTPLDALVGDFTVGERTYFGEIDQVEALLEEAGFDRSISPAGEFGFARECCGEFDGVFVTLETSSLNFDAGSDGRLTADTVVATVSYIDSDVQLLIPFAVIIGAGLLLSAVAVGRGAAEELEPVLTNA